MADKTVLLVEDEPLLLQSTGRLLEGQFNIVPAINGQTAFDLLQQFHVGFARPLDVSGKKGWTSRRS